MALAPILAITDGTTRYDLLPYLKRWTPGRPEMKGGGVMRDSPMASGSRLVMYNYANVIESFVLDVSRNCQDGVAWEMQELDRLLKQGIEYWISWSPTPVWIEVRGSQETGTRYGCIVNYQISGDNSPFAQPLLGLPGAVNRDTILTIEHTIWADYPPGERGDAAASGEQLWSQTAITYGREACADDEVFVVNNHHLANISHIYDWTAGPAWSANKIGMAVPFDIFTIAAVGVPANGDIVYFGSDTAPADPSRGGPFTNLVFSIETAATYGAGDSVAWEYYSEAAGPAWAALTVVDFTNNHAAPTDGSQPFQSTGVGNISFVQPTDWRTLAVNGTTGYWIRAVVTVATGITRARQGTRDIYSTVWCRASIDDAQITGDIPALLAMTVSCESETSQSAPILDGYISRVVAGLRTRSRGDYFQAFINLTLSGGNNSANIGAAGNNWTSSAGANTAQVPLPPAANYDTSAAGEYCARYSVAGVTAEQVEVTQSWDGDDSFYGIYHPYVRYKVLSGASNEMRARLKLSPLVPGGVYGHVQESTLRYLQADGEWHALDFGRADLTLGMRKAAWLGSGFVIELHVETTAAGAHAALFYDLILIPADEWIGSFDDAVGSASTAGLPLHTGRMVEIDSASQPLYYNRPMALYQLDDTPTYAQAWLANSAGPPIFQANVDQDIYFFMERFDSTTDVPAICPPHLLGRVQFWRLARYAGMRGDR